ncbi:MAG TPA: SEC-C metal-binding domain-containing protein, partial [Thermoanaerobaculia bacterium]|nr:SEC-C metal-binding domain-containing protein [Thermoanaerobaculia bacterium]
MRVGRNERCHCGSGKKNKNCCMEKDARRASRGMVALIIAIAVIAAVGVVASITDSKERTGSAISSAPPGPAPPG